MNITIGMTSHNCLNASKMTMEALFTYTNGKFNFVVVDNASTDGSQEYFESFKKRTTSPYKFIPLDQNYGCARSFNEVFKTSSEDDYVLLINNDIVVTPNWLLNLAKYMEAHPEVGICSPHPIDNHVNEDTKFRWFGYNKDSYDRAGMVDEGWFNYARAIEDGPDEELDGFHGSAFCVTPECRRSVGFFDEQFLKGCYEDLDYNYRSIKAGFLSKVTSKSVIFHLGGTTQHHVTVNEGGSGYREINRQKFERKWGINTVGLICSRALLWDNSIPNVNTRIIL